MGGVVIAFCTVGILVVMMLRCYTKYKTKAKSASTGIGNRSAQTHRHQEQRPLEQRQPQRHQREQSISWAQRLEERWRDRSRREILSYIAYSRGLSQPQRFQCPLSSPGSSRRFRRASVVVSTGVSSLRSACPLYGRHRHSLFLQSRQVAGYGRAVLRDGGDDSVSISAFGMWETSQAAPFPEAVLLLPSYDDVMAESRQEAGNDAEESHHPKDKQTSVQCEEQQSLLVPEEEHPHQRPRGSGHLQPHAVRPPPPPYRGCGEFRGEVSLTASWDQLNNTSGLEDVGDISRPPSYRSLHLDTETDEVTAMQLRNNPSSQSMDDLQSMDDSHGGDHDSHCCVEDDDSQFSIESDTEGLLPLDGNTSEIAEARFSRRGDEVYVHLPTSHILLERVRRERDVHSQVHVHQSRRDVSEAAGQRQQMRWPMGRPPPVYDESVQP